MFRPGNITKSNHAVPNMAIAGTQTKLGYWVSFDLTNILFLPLSVPLLE
jgi:hypothetical protein